ncbi:(d)CMP kinase [Oribacterium sp. NK2B42]|uniref:(d)CMP kinase n=1 Tax=Oribacterium sp. NK2B42 TaxID=689781 RepID=UPI0003FEDA85|nr:(d)CMP kinase [Oribacterium sp. NK2B42]MBO5598066.1 (d)CMP kinase [Oribacterium sp.]MBO6309431.1 (d)CMP kinase [Oribacterium sp.]MBP3806166.1 (d)CMP kinase [Oribacterium sp.]
MPYSIAIDGPAGAGKSTIAKAVARELGYVYIDTGAMYRAVGLYCLNNGTDINDESLVVAGIKDIDISISYDEEGAQQVFLNGENVSSKIRTQEVGAAASTVSQYQPVRDLLVALQQKLASKTSVVMDGRDIGSKVLPNADTKIYLTASVEERARRRAKELMEKGETCDIKEVEKEIAERDYRDMHRENSPLIKVEDAVLIDSSDLTIDETIDSILDIVIKR